MELDTFVAAHRAEWDRLESLARRRGRLSGAEADELVELYQRTATHLSMVQSASPDPALVSRLSTLVATGRAAVTSASGASWTDVSRFVLRAFPVAVYRARWWWLSIAAATVLVAVSIGAWVSHNPDVVAAVATPEDLKRLVDQDFADYYTSNPAGSFAFKVWTNNAWVAALSLVGGALLCLPGVYILWQNALNIGLVGGLMAYSGRLDLFFGLITPHGLLELTAVFVAGGAGIRLGWQIVAPGPRPRSVALAEEGRSTLTIALGLVVVLLVSGVVEAFVTPSPLPTWARIGIGAVVWSAFLAYVWVLGRRGVHEGATGDVTDRAATTDLAPYAG
ncbi:MAG: stage II sporulation protein M [Frankiales bacterium]|nr:stage II sporulation protein M [Frankiales bacterium]